MIETGTLRPGQIFSDPVYTIGDNLLVPPLVPLRQKDIDILLFWDIEAVATEGTVIETEGEEIPEEDILEKEIPEGEFLKEFFGEVPKSFLEDVPVEEIPDEEDVSSGKEETIAFSIKDVQQNSASYRAYKSIIERLNSIFIGIKTGIDMGMSSIEHISVQLLQNLRDNPESFIAYILGGEVSGNELAKSSVNTAILSALIAQALNLPSQKIQNIVSGALLHDIGMLRLSKGITEKKGGLSDAELEQIKSHALHTSKIITKELFGPQEVNLIALQHHERWDGKGYPDQLVGTAIDIGARIVSVADAFEAMVSKKSYRNSIIGYQAIKNLLADNSRRFDPTVIMIFTKIMGIYPIGSIVRLNDGSVARVIRVHTDAPMRPVVQMLMDNGGNAISARQAAIVDLLAERTLFIKEAIDPAEFAASMDE